MLHRLRDGVKGNLPILLALGCLLAGFLYGTASDHFEWFPYSQLRAAASSVQSLVARLPAFGGGTRDEPQSDNTLTYTSTGSVKSLATALLPLTIETFNLPQVAKITLTAGAICEIGDSVLIIDRLGAAFRFELKSGKVTVLDWPQFNNYDQLLKSTRTILKYSFRVHGLTCIAEQDRTRVLVAHEFFEPAGLTTHMMVSSLRIGADFRPQAGTWDRLFKSAALPGTAYFANGAGGRMAADGKGHLYLTIGDYNLNGVELPETVPQDPKSDFGAMFRIDLATGARTKMSLGHRNPQGIAVLHDGEILATEQAAKGGDELNRIVDGSNYGWPLVTYGTSYETYDWPLSKDQGRHAGFTKPVFAWVPSVAATNLIESTRFHARWQHDLLVASLKAGTLSRLRYEDGAVKYSEPIWLGTRIRDLIETADHRIVLWTDKGELIVLSVDEKRLALNKRQESSILEPEGLNCMSCHHVGITNETDVAPSLSAILNRKVASDNFAGYTDGMRNAGGVWTEERLRAFLLDPDAFAPGTNMVIRDLSPSQMDQAIEYLKKLD